jgi:hypothetical protein
MYTVCNRKIPRVTNKLRERGNIKTRRVRGVIRLKIMLAREKKKRKVKFPCNICMENHLTHQFPWLEEAQNLLAQERSLVLTNPFSQEKKLAQDSSSTNTPGGNKGSPTLNVKKRATNIYMMKSKANLQTKAHNYGMPESFEKGKEASNPLSPLQIENTMGETMTHIPKGAFKKDSHILNARSYRNYSVVEDLAQTPCEMSTLEFL